MSEAPPGYPADLVDEVVLADGRRLLIRPILPSDAERLERLFSRLSSQTLYRRFFAPVPRLRPAMLRRLVTVDYVGRLALVALSGDDVVGVARFDRLAVPGSEGAGREAEAAVLVEDAWQGSGVGTAMLWRLAAAARQRGIGTLVADVLGENVPMATLLRHLGRAVEVSPDGAHERVRVKLDDLPGTHP